MCDDDNARPPLPLGALGFGGLTPFYSGLTRDFGGAGPALDNATKVTYPGTPHSYFGRRATEFSAASADVRTRRLAFIQAA